MTITHNGFSATRRLILQGAASVALVGSRTSRSASGPPSLRPTTNTRRTRSSRRTARTRSRRYTARPPSLPDKVSLDAPEIAENGAVVPISVTSSLANVTSISILVAENPNALAASYKIPAGTLPSVANRLKMAKTTNVIAVVEAGGKLYSTSKEVKVTVGGCGG